MLKYEIDYNYYCSGNIIKTTRNPLPSSCVFKLNLLITEHENKYDPPNINPSGHSDHNLLRKFRTGAEGSCQNNPEL